MLVDADTKAELDAGKRPEDGPELAYIISERCLHYLHNLPFPADRHDYIAVLGALTLADMVTREAICQASFRSPLVPDEAAPSAVSLAP